MTCVIQIQTRLISIVSKPIKIVVVVVVIVVFVQKRTVQKTFGPKKSSSSSKSEISLTLDFELL